MEKKRKDERLQIRIRADLKERYMRVLEAKGLTFSAHINMLITELVNQHEKEERK